MKKRFLFSIVLLLVASFIFTSFAESKIEDTIHGFFANTFQLTPEDYQINIMKDGKRYIFSVQLLSHPDDEDGIYLGTVTSKGDLKISKTPEKVPVGVNVDNQMKRSFPDVNAMYAWQQKWKEKLPEEEKNNFPPKYQVIFDLNMVKETDEYIGRDTALGKALETLLENPLFDKELLSHYYRSVEILYIPKDLGVPVYHFLFEPLSPMHAEFQGNQGDKAYAAHQKYLENYYRKRGKDPLQYLSVVLDARSGLALEAPYIHTESGSVEHYLDFFNRDLIKGEPIR